MQGLLYKCLLLIIMQKTNISSNNSPKISIIVPVYNGMKYFPLNIDSAISDNPNIETIIVDDGSTDGSSTYLDNCYANNRNVNVYHKNNGGIVSARNYGLARATIYSFWIKMIISLLKFLTLPHENAAISDAI